MGSNSHKIFISNFFLVSSGLTISNPENQNDFCDRSTLILQEKKGGETILVH